MEQKILKLILVEMREMKGDMSEVKEKLTKVENRLTNVEKEVAETKAEIAEVKNEIVEIKVEVAEVKDEVRIEADRLNTQLKEQKELIEFNKETCQAIMNVITAHYKEFKKFVKLNTTQHHIYDAKLLKYNKEN